MQRSSKNGETSLARYDIIVKTFWGLPSCFLVWIENSSSQHQTSTTFSELVREDGSTLLLPAPRRASSHPLQNRVPRVQVLLPLTIHLSPGLAKTAWPGAFSCLCSFGHGLLIPALCCIRCCPLASGHNWPLPPFSSPAPKTHPVSPFWGFSGCVFLFFAVFGAQNFRANFCATCHIVFTS